MKKQIICLPLVLATTLPMSLWAHGDEKHEGKAVTPKTAQEAWTAIQYQTKEIGEMIEAKNLKSVHEAIEKIQEAGKVLDKMNPLTDSDKKKKLSGYLDQLLKQADKVHDTADETKSVDKTQAEYKKLQGALKLVESMLPDSFKVKVSYACSMHPDQTSDKPGNCPKCGMKMEMASK